MLNFSVGPVMMDETVRAIGCEQIPYFRTEEFSAMMQDSESMMLRMVHAGELSKVVFLTGSGTAAMEAAVMNVLTERDRVLVVNGGSFGKRFAGLCDIHGIPFTEISLSAGSPLTEADLKPFENGGYTAFLVNVCETSTGVLYDMEMISGFCRRNHLLLIADAISSFLADPFDMSAFGADVMITGSQKALACPPGVSVIVLSGRAVERVKRNEPKCLYLNLKAALSDAERGQTPFTPAVGILRQLHERLRQIERNGGVSAETARIVAQAKDFREKIRKFPFAIFTESLSNAVTPLHPLTASAYDIFRLLKDEYGIWICPNGGELKDTVFRVGHIGALTPEDNDTLIAALRDLQTRNLI